MSESTLLPYSVVFMANQGDMLAMEQVVNHYKGYIFTLAQRKIVDENGNPALVVDDEWKRRLELKLITAVMKFNF
ncbi:helix-turn-helix domain-containing protein [Oceanobacillus sojae]|uniref:helix-turn-helix domain-containing protein n=1 Tax=Oceanobacillus sojae TaxID=582851 RepID=UPI0021A2E14D|nr:helix-turn-helix domain-containing protein [Oceanobacillus sojae]MCT1905251.1 helix-turn-helix domain-containing protein [Oceanobacillus sojae]